MKSPYCGFGGVAPKRFCNFVEILDSATLWNFALQKTPCSCIAKSHIFSIENRILLIFPAFICDKLTTDTHFHHLMENIEFNVLSVFPNVLSIEKKCGAACKTEGKYMFCA